MPLTFEFHT
jgi:hypothetical protein